MKLNEKLLNDINLSEMYDQIDPNDAKRGLYNNIFYILRLRHDVHEVLRTLVLDESNEYYTEFEKLQAMSTLFHENLHWWQYIGSTSGLIMSLSFPAQVLASLDSFKEYLEIVGNKKPIILYNKYNLTKENEEDAEFKAINIILNTFYDIYYYRQRVKRPQKIAEACKEVFFESIGHSFHMVYDACVKLLAATFDENYSFLPNPESWSTYFSELKKNSTEGFFYGSRIGLPQIGLEDLYEGQARFNQILYLNISSNKMLDWKEFQEAGMLEDVYYSAFNMFLKILEEPRPENIDSPIVALYLLLIDIAINPLEGFPFDISNHEEFVLNTDPALRFIRLCQTVKDLYPHFINTITEYSAKNYFYISTVLCKTLGYHVPLEYKQKLSDWYANQDSIIELLKENEAFKYKEGNMLVRLILGRFLSFQQDKFQRPEYFCWPGVFLHGQHNCKDFNILYKKHQALFKENEDMDISPAMLPGIDDETLRNTAGEFYSMLTLFELCRQWVFCEGCFSYDFQWISKKHDKEEVKKIVGEAFNNIFGVSPENFENVKQKPSPSKNL